MLHGLYRKPKHSNSTDFFILNNVIVQINIQCQILKEILKNPFFAIRGASKVTYCERFSNILHPSNSGPSAPFWQRFLRADNKQIEKAAVGKKGPRRRSQKSVSSILSQHICTSSERVPKKNRRFTIGRSGLDKKQGTLVSETHLVRNEVMATISLWQSTSTVEASGLTLAVNYLNPLFPKYSRDTLRLIKHVLRASHSKRVIWL